MNTHKRKHQKGAPGKRAQSKVIARKNMAKTGKKISAPMRRRRAGRGPEINPEAALSETSEIVKEIE